NPARDPESPTWHWLLAWTLPSVAVLCAWQGLRAGRMARVIFWIGALAGVALTAVLLQGRLEVADVAGDRVLVLAAGLLPVAALVIAFIRGLRSAGFGWLPDIPIAAVCLAGLAIGAYFFVLKKVVEPQRRLALQSWADAGRPMPEFETSLVPVQENAALRDLAANLKPFGVTSLYKTAGDTKTIQTPPELMDLYVSTVNIPGDMVKNVPKASAWLDGHAEDFNRLYQGLLQGDAPVWSCNPEEGSMARMPNLDAMRKVAELICSDAYHRIQKNDTKGAADAIAAGRRMVQNLGEQPIMASNMIYLGIEAQYAPVLARLPAAPDDMQRLTQDVAMSRRQFARTVQWEAWRLMHDVEAGRNDPRDAGVDIRRLWPVQPLPEWLGKKSYPFFCDSLGSVYCSQACIYQADLVRISGKAADLAGADLGTEEMDASNLAHLNPYEPNWSHAWLRVNFVLLIREQAAVIRYARAQMQAGKSGDLGDQSSVVIPGAKWKIEGDTAQNAFSIKLSPVPAWARDASVMGNPFFMVPLEGWRTSWQLLPVPPPKPKGQ
ncbi:MAG TPA: hypothetical protein VG733_12675, partial [Chthoniobacteraceae bacterium]|nr:hypothetical protein [Chthoniobacteraceae bacterium]